MKSLLAVFKSELLSEWIERFPNGLQWGRTNLCCDPVMLVPFVAGADRNAGVRGHPPGEASFHASSNMEEES